MGARACKQGDSVFASRRVAFASAGPGALLPGSAAAPIRMARGRVSQPAAPRGAFSKLSSSPGVLPSEDFDQGWIHPGKGGGRKSENLGFPTLESREVVTCEKQSVSVGPSLYTGIPSPSLSLRTGPEL